MPDRRRRVVKKKLVESELRTGVREGGHILGFIIVERPKEDGPEYAAYVRVSWTRGFRVLRKWRDDTEREYRHLGLLYQAAREFGFMSPVTVYRAGSPELLRFRGVLARDGGSEGADKPAVEAADDCEDEQQPS